MRKSFWSFLIWDFVFLAVMFSFGMLVLAPNAAIATETFTGIGGYLLKTTIKVVLAVILAIIQSLFLLKLGLGFSASAIKKQFQEEHNDSMAYLIVGLAGSAVIAIALATGSNIHQYLYVFCTKVPVGYLIASIITTIITRISGVKSIQEFRSWIDAKSNDSHAILVAGILVMSMFLAMNA